MSFTTVLKDEADCFQVGLSGFTVGRIDMNDINLNT